MNGEELNQQDSTQPEVEQSAEGSNVVGKPSEPISHDSRIKELETGYNNKFQQLAQERKAFEEERNSWSQRNGAQQQNYNGQHVQPQNYETPQANPQQVYTQLVNDFGVDAANAIVQAAQLTSQPLLQQLATAQQELHSMKVDNSRAQINAMGKEKFGDEWKQYSEQVIDAIVKYNGLPLEQAWYAIRGQELMTKAQQSATDAAYKNINNKQESNVSQNKTQVNNSAPQISNFADAFNAAWKQHNS